MTTDNRTNEPTEAQVEAAAKAIYSVQRPGGVWDENQQPRWHRKLARAALVAAQGAAPQAECDCGAGPGSAVCKKVCATRAPVLPSSGVDEARADAGYRALAKDPEYLAIRQQMRDARAAAVRAEAAEAAVERVRAYIESDPSISIAPGSPGAIILDALAPVTEEGDGE